VAEEVYVIWGKWKFPWDIFCAAYGGRSFFASKQWKKPSEAFSCVRDARKRYRDENFKSDLATVLATFTYSKETYPQDRIYASLVLVKCVGLQQLIAPDYKKQPRKYFMTQLPMLSMNDRIFIFGARSHSSARERCGASLPGFLNGLVQLAKM
jgi:hypothetical protein